MEVLFESAERGVPWLRRRPLPSRRRFADRDDSRSTSHRTKLPRRPRLRNPRPKPASDQAGLGRLLKKFGIK